MKTEYDMLVQIEIDLIKKLEATRVLIKMFTREDTYFKPVEFIGLENGIDEKERYIPRIKILTLAKLIEAIRDVFTSNLYQKVKDNYALAAYCFYSKQMFPNTGYKDIGSLIGVDYQSALYHSKKHDTLISKYPEYSDYIKKLNTKYSIKEVSL